MKIIVKLICAGAVLASLSPLGAQTLAVFNTAGNPNPTLPATSVDPSVTVSDLTLGSAFGYGTGGLGNFGTTPGSWGGYYGGNYPVDLASAITTNTYFSFTVTPTVSGTVSLTGIDLSGALLAAQVANGTPLRDFALESSIGGFTSTGSLATITGAGYGGTPGSNVTLGAAYQNLTAPVEFRLYVYDEPGAASGGYFTSGFSGVIDINGSLASVPEPSISSSFILGFSLLAVALVYRRKTSAGTIA